MPTSDTGKLLEYLLPDSLLREGEEGGGLVWLCACGRGRGSSIDYFVVSVNNPLFYYRDECFVDW